VFSLASYFVGHWTLDFGLWTLEFGVRAGVGSFWFQRQFKNDDRKNTDAQCGKDAPKEAHASIHRLVKPSRNIIIDYIFGISRVSHQRDHLG
jgi:hypothetical protein